MVCWFILTLLTTCISACYYPPYIPEGKTIPDYVNTTGDIDGKNITYIAAGSTHSIAVSSEGEVFIWGDGELNPVAVNSSGVLKGKKIVQVAGGDYYTVAVSSDGEVFGWGRNSNGQIGIGTLDKDVSEPVAVNMDGVLRGKWIRYVSAGYLHVVAVSGDGEVFTWGDNDNGQLGDGTNEDKYVPVAVNVDGVLNGKFIIQVAAGTYHTVALSGDGQLYAWGHNLYGQLGDGSIKYSNVPVAVNIDGVLEGKFIVQVVAGHFHTVALSSDGKVFAWGMNSYGQLGDGNAVYNQTFPVPVNTNGFLKEKIITQISAGGDFTLALSLDGQLFSWGENYKGQLGIGSRDNTYLPLPVLTTGVLNRTPITQVSAGQEHTLALSANSQLFSWGTNTNGQLGDGSLTYNTAVILIACVQINYPIIIGLVLCSILVIIVLVAVVVSASKSCSQQQQKELIQEDDHETSVSIDLESDTE